MISLKLYTPCENCLKRCKFNFDDACLREFRLLKEKFVSTPIIISPDWGKPFEVM